MPLAYFLKAYNALPIQIRRPKVLVSNRVTPGIEKFQLTLALRIFGMEQADFIPEPDAKPIKVTPNVGGARVSLVQHSTSACFRQKKCLYCRVRHKASQHIHTFGMQVAAEALKLPGQKHHIRLIDLLGRVSSAWTHAANAGVGRLYLL